MNQVNIQVKTNLTGRVTDFKYTDIRFLKIKT